MTIRVSREVSQVYRLAFLLALLLLAQPAAGQGPQTDPNAPAFARRSGPYLQANTGFSFSRREQVVIVSPVAGVQSDTEDLGTSFVGELAVGWAFDAPARIELVFGRADDYEFDALRSSVSTNLKGDIESTRVMLNVYAELEQYATERVMPFVGAGIGWSRNEVEPLSAQIFSGPFAGQSITHSGKTRREFAYQFMGGSSVRLSESFELVLFARWVDAGRIQTGSNQTLSGGATFANQPSAKADLKSFDFMAGLRYRF